MSAKVESQPVEKLLEEWTRFLIDLKTCKASARFEPQRIKSHGDILMNVWLNDDEREWVLSYWRGIGQYWRAIMALGAVKNYYLKINKDVGFDAFQLFSLLIPEFTDIQDLAEQPDLLCTAFECALQPSICVHNEMDYTPHRSETIGKRVVISKLQGMQDVEVREVLHTLEGLLAIYPAFFTRLLILEQKGKILDRAAVSSPDGALLLDQDMQLLLVDVRQHMVVELCASLLQTFRRQSGKDPTTYGPPPIVAEFFARATPWTFFDAVKQQHLPDDPVISLFLKEKVKLQYASDGVHQGKALPSTAPEQSNEVAQTEAADAVAQEAALLSIDSCYKCRAPSALSKCSSCAVARYCTRECQRADWKAHKPSCKKLKNIRLRHAERQQQDVWTVPPVHSQQQDAAERPSIPTEENDEASEAPRLTMKEIIELRSPRTPWLDILSIGPLQELTNQQKASVCFRDAGICVLKSLLSEGSLAELAVLIEGSVRALTKRLMEVHGSDDVEVGVAAGYADMVKRSPGRVDYLLPPEARACVERDVVPLVLPFAQAQLGARAHLMFVGVVEAKAGCERQGVHRDSAALFDDSELEDVHVLPAHALNVFIPLKAISSLDGATCFVPGSHREGNETVVDAEKHSFSGAPLSAGDAVVFDYRLFHWGGANVSSDSRLVLYLTFARSWFRDTQNFPEDGAALAGTQSSAPEVPSSERPLAPAQGQDNTERMQRRQEQRAALDALD